MGGLEPGPPLNPALDCTIVNVSLLFALLGFGTRCPTTLFRPAHCRCLWDG